MKATSVNRSESVEIRDDCLIHCEQGSLPLLIPFQHVYPEYVGNYRDRVMFGLFSRLVDCIPLATIITAAGFIAGSAFAEVFTSVGPLFLLFATGLAWAVFRHLHLDSYFLYYHFDEVRELTRIRRAILRIGMKLPHLSPEEECLLNEGLAARSEAERASLFERIAARREPLVEQRRVMVTGDDAFLWDDSKYSTSLFSRDLNPQSLARLERHASALEIFSLIGVVAALVCGITSGFVLFQTASSVGGYLLGAAPALVCSIVAVWMCLIGRDVYHRADLYRIYLRRALLELDIMPADVRPWELVPIETIMAKS